MDRRFVFEQTTVSRIVVAANARARLPELVGDLDPDGVVVVHDHALTALAHEACELLDARTLVGVVADENTKLLANVDSLADSLHLAGATRQTALVAIGGGTIADLAGFTASIYLRGMPFVSCPTTTLAMCDAALGGKNGVDHCGLKNRLGTIRQPACIVMDTDWLGGLPDAAFREGLVEAVKKAAVLDAAAFVRLERLAPQLLARDEAAIRETIELAIAMKMEVVLADERESGRRRALNAGHTIGHALESFAGGALRHGHAVAIGLLAECRAAGVDPQVTTRLRSLLRAIGVPTEIPAELADVDELWQRARRDKKAVRGEVPMYVPERIGAGRSAALDLDGLRRALA
jgi:3-dehydroquinate synthase